MSSGRDGGSGLSERVAATATSGSGRAALSVDTDTHIEQHSLWTPALT